MIKKNIIIITINDDENVFSPQQQARDENEAFNAKKLNKISIHQSIYHWWRENYGTSFPTKLYFCQIMQ